MNFSKHPVWAMAFRPLYSLTAVYGAISVLLWGFGYQGTSALPSFFWHAHEMIWGYAGGVVVAFLLTAVATWTKQPPVGGGRLILLVACWLLARLFSFIPQTALLSGFCGTAFYWLAAYYMGQSVFAAKSSRNYIAVAALVLMGITVAAFHTALYMGNSANLQQNLFAGLVMVAGFIGLIGSRIIAFFTSRRLNTPQPASPQWALVAPLALPMLMAALMSLHTALPLAAFCGIACGILGLVQTVRWWAKGTAKEPLLWTLHAGYAATALGLIVMGIGQWQPQLMSAGVHFVAVGGIGMLTVSMMTRTALGHTGRNLYPAPKPMPTAFLLMLAALLVRVLAAVMLYVNQTGYQHSLRLSAALFAASLLMYAWRYTPWLLRPRLDGKPG